MPQYEDSKPVHRWLYWFEAVRILFFVTLGIVLFEKKRILNERETIRWIKTIGDLLIILYKRYQSSYNGSLSFRWFAYITKRYGIVSIPFLFWFRKTLGRTWEKRVIIMLIFREWVVPVTVSTITLIGPLFPPRLWERIVPYQMSQFDFIAPFTRTWTFDRLFHALCLIELFAGVSVIDQVRSRLSWCLLIGSRVSFFFAFRYVWKLVRILLDHWKVSSVLKQNPQDSSE